MPDGGSAFIDNHGGKSPGSQASDVSRVAGQPISSPRGSAPMTRCETSGAAVQFPWGAAPPFIADLEAEATQLGDPFSFADGIAWHKPAHRAVMASVKLGAWMSAALDDPKVCEAMKADIREWFSAGEPMETLCQALAHFAAETQLLTLESDASRESTNALCLNSPAPVPNDLHDQPDTPGER